MGCHMAKVSISKAAKLAGVSRTALYKSYINKGLISTSRDESGKKCIDTSEILRVFNELKNDSKGLQVDTLENTDTKEKVSTETAKDFEIKLLQSQLEEFKKREQEAQERENWYKKKIDDLTDTMKLLEAPKQTQRLPFWWQFWK